MGDSYSKPSSTPTPIPESRPGQKHNPVYKIDLKKNCIVNFGTNAEYYKLTRKSDNR
jgi:hypothetical protein